MRGLDCGWHWAVYLVVDAMNPDKYDFWKNEVVQAAREIVITKKGVLTGFLPFLSYIDAQQRLWDKVENEPK